MEDRPLAYVKAWGLKDPPGRAEVIRAYRRRAQKLHPDRAGNTPQANEQFIQLRQQYLLLLRYASDPGSFAPASTPRSTTGQGGATPPPSPPVPPAPEPQAWIVPPGNLTLRKRWPLRLAWAGGSILMRFSRAVPCGCRVGCRNCLNTLVRMENISVQISVPPLPSPSTRVRLPGLGHKGDLGKVGVAILELAWTGMGGWSARQGALHMTMKVPRNAPWVYCRGPDAHWYRLEGQKSLYRWVSPAGMEAILHIKPGLKVQAVSQCIHALSWALSRPAPLPSRLKLACSALANCWTGTSRVSK